jgi:hypothetical protein
MPQWSTFVIVLTNPSCDTSPAFEDSTFRDDLLGLISAAASDNIDFDRIIPLLRAALSDRLDDTLIWDQVCVAAAEYTPPPRPVASSLQQTPWLHNMSSFANPGIGCRFLGGPFHPSGAVMKLLWSWSRAS